MGSGIDLGAAIMDMSGDAYARPNSDILSQIKDSCADLRPARRRVAGMVLADIAFGVDASTLVEPSVDPTDVLRAAGMVASAHRVLVFGLGGSSTALAQETRDRLFRYGVVVSAHADSHVTRMSAATLSDRSLIPSRRFTNPGRTHAR